MADESRGLHYIVAYLCYLALYGIGYVCYDRGCDPMTTEQHPGIARLTRAIGMSIMVAWIFATIGFLLTAVASLP